MYFIVSVVSCNSFNCSIYFILLRIKPHRISVIDWFQFQRYEIPRYIGVVIFQTKFLTPHVFTEGSKAEVFCGWGSGRRERYAGTGIIDGDASLSAFVSDRFQSRCRPGTAQIAAVGIRLQQQRKGECYWRLMSAT